MSSIVPMPLQSFGSLPAGQAGQAGYEYDIFISYRHPPTLKLRWTGNNSISS